MKRLTVATTNLNKVREFQSLLAGFGDWEIRVQPSTVPPIDETGRTFMENAILKAVHTSAFVEGFVVADDSGLCVDALEGRPGIYSNRYASDDAARIQRVLTEMQTIADESRAAAFVCAIAVAEQGKVIWTGEGQVHGTINRTPRGVNGFGYDPIFRLPEFGRTMAELTLEEKNRISHRGRALQELMRHFVVSERL